MSSPGMTTAEKRALNAARQRAVRNAWSREKGLVTQGKGTRDWSVQEQGELLKTGRVSGYEGHHMKSVHAFPQYADCADNIQFLTWKEHFAAHDRSFRSNQTNGYYDPKTGEIHPFQDGELTALSVLELGERYQETPGQDPDSAARQNAAMETTQGNRTAGDIFAENDISKDTLPGNENFENVEIFADNEALTDTVPGNDVFETADTFSENGITIADTDGDHSETALAEAEDPGESIGMEDAGMEQ